MDKRYHKKGLRILAPERQNSEVKAIEKLVDDHKIKFPILKGTTRPESMTGIPHSVVFDASGELVYEGHPMAGDFDKAVKKALRGVKEMEEVKEDALAETKPLIAERTWTNAEGKPLVASILSTTETTVKFKLKGGREVDYPIADLSAEDQEVIKSSSAESAEGE